MNFHAVRHALSYTFHEFVRGLQLMVTPARRIPVRVRADNQAMPVRVDRQ